jgi:hypothetical protein
MLQLYRIITTTRCLTHFMRKLQGEFIRFKNDHYKNTNYFLSITGDHSVK